MKHVKWTSIEGMHNVRRGLRAYQKTRDSFELPKVIYKAKVKLHGTNAGIQVHPNGTVIAQSRSNNLNPPHSDNNGFGAWVKENEKAFAVTAKALPITIFGEWCGTGIQKGVAISEIKEKVFAVFAVQIHAGQWLETVLDTDVLCTDPVAIRNYVPDLKKLYILPWIGVDIKIDWGNETSMQKSADKINSYVDAIEKCDPWVKENFGVSGTGEGVVMYPIRIGFLDTQARLVDRELITTYMFKAKGEKHKVVKQKKPAQIDPEVVKSIDEFVKMFLTESRLEQGVAEGCGGSKIPQNTGKFVKWIGQDVKKESAAELESAGLDWKQVSKPISRTASNWFRQ